MPITDRHAVNIVFIGRHRPNADRAQDFLRPAQFRELRLYDLRRRRIANDVGRMLIGLVSLHLVEIFRIEIEPGNLDIKLLGQVGNRVH